MSDPRSTFVPKFTDTLARDCQNVASAVHGTVPGFQFSVTNPSTVDYWQDEIGDILYDAGEPMTLE